MGFFALFFLLLKKKSVQFPGVIEWILITDPYHSLLLFPSSSLPLFLSLSLSLSFPLFLLSSCPPPPPLLVIIVWDLDLALFSPLTSLSLPPCLSLSLSLAILPR